MGRDMMRLRRGILLNTPHEEQASGAVASFATDIGKLKECVVGIEPVQDLHGYDNPWPPGGGKNLLDMTIYTGGSYNGTIGNVWNLTPASVQLTQNGSVFTIELGSWSTRTFFFPLMDGEIVHFKAVFSATDMATTYGYLDSEFHLLTKYNQTGATITRDINFTGSETYAYGYVLFAPRSSKQTITITKPQLEKGSTATSWTPYSNICPISGWSEAKVTGTGKNLLNTAIKRLYSSTICEIGSSYTAFDLHLKAGTYTMSASFSGTISYGGYCREKNGSGNIAFWYSNQTVGGIRKGTVTLPEGDYRFWLYYSGGISLDVIEWFQLELGSTASAYEPYQGNTYTIDLDGTRYGGTLNLLTGVFTGDRAIVDLGTLIWIAITVSTESGKRFYSGSLNLTIKAPENLSVIPNIVCSMYKTKIASQYNQAIDGITIHTNKSVQIYDSTKKDLSAEEFKAAMSGVQLVYELADPFDVQLTPAQLRAIKGQNNIFADCGDIAVKYWKH